MKYETECQAITKEIAKQFQNSNNDCIVHYKPAYLADPRSFNDPSYPAEEEAKKEAEAMREAQEKILEDDLIFSEFILEDENIRKVILGLARKICEEIYNG